MPREMESNSRQELQATEQNGGIVEMDSEAPRTNAEIVPEPSQSDSPGASRTPSPENGSG